MPKQKYASDGEWEAILRRSVFETTKLFERKGLLPKEFYTTAQAANFLNVSDRTMQNWRSKGIGPKYSYNNDANSYFYSRESLLKFILEESGNKPGAKTTYTDPLLQERFAKVREVLEDLGIERAGKQSNRRRKRRRG